MRPVVVHRERVAVAAAWWSLPQVVAHMGPVALASATLDTSPALVAASRALVAQAEWVAQLEAAAFMAYRA